MKVRATTTWAEVEDASRIFSDSTIAELKQAGVRYYLGLPDLWAMPIAMFVQLIESGRVDTLHPLTDSAFAHYFIEACKDFVAQAEERLRLCTLPPDASDTWLNAGKLQMSEGEAVVQFMRQFYGCTYKEAEQATMSEYLLARRYAYNERVESKNLRKHYER